MDFLPPEIIVHILSLLHASDLVRVSRVNKKFAELVSDAQILRHLDFRRAYTCTGEDFKKFFLPKWRCQHVQYLNLDHVYWMTVPVSSIVKMKSLTSLHLLDTSLTLKQLHTILTAGLKVKELSISLQECCTNGKEYKLMEEMKDALCQLVTLRILSKVVNKYLMDFPLQFSGPVRVVFYTFELDLVAVNRLLPKDCDVSQHPDEAVQLMEVARKREAWKEQGLSHTCPDTHLAALRLVRQLVVISRSHLNDLTTVIHACPNLKSLQILKAHSIILDFKVLCEMAPQLKKLRVANQVESLKGLSNAVSTLRHLTHLSLPARVLSESRFPREAPTVAKPDPGLRPAFKRQRVGIAASSSREDVEEAAFNLVLENCSQLIMLEIGSTDCLEVRERHRDSSLHWKCLENIKKLKRLTHLTLKNIPVTNGAFLMEIARGCTKLEFLRLENLGPTGKCCYLKDLVDSVTFLPNLAHLRIEQNYLAPGTALFRALLKCPRLQRLSVISELDMLLVDLCTLEQLIMELQNLVFVFVSGAETPQTKCKAFMKKFKKPLPLRPALVVHVTNEFPSFPHPLTFTRTHLGNTTEMVYSRSWLAGCDSLYNYNTFPQIANTLTI